ncbi:efflux RND transporter periplasmic adaptor subunit [Stieleria sp. TO1_6]|uniref:efflux RND transporter periplasmic adaptor subunit n=1 Tax=Stieleria tagensis TaxID=2956795 RepID=UPI00209B56B9|nr:efflux RND transporter periplasmic adaptor subunit [Stieleria tagensis]MCO8124769.1 efflux RND transporter periplasmic adaptor subunit [Stieleria tagensis]
MQKTTLEDDRQKSSVSTIHASDAESSETRLTLAPEQWQASGIEIEAVNSGPFQKRFQLTGKISLNQDRLAHIYSMVEGTVDSVSVSLGQRVKTDDLLAVVHSREVGAAKLELYQARLQLELAKTKDRLQSEIAKNANQLIESLRQGADIKQIEREFRNRPMGDFRERALASYSNLLKSEADVDRLRSVAESGAVSGKQLLAATANRNADQATVQSRIEQIQYELNTSTLLTSQAVKVAQAKTLVAATSLKILNVDQNDIDTIDPAGQGESISHYAIRAPFDGTVLTKDVVLREQVRPDVMLLSIADLSTVWVTANIYEEHLPLLDSLKEQTVLVRNAALPDRVFQARVFYTGEIMDETTRTISLRAIADNADRALKPGMFVTIEFPSAHPTDVVQVPLSAVHEHDGKQFVFVHDQDGQFTRRDVVLGPANQSSVVVMQGVQAGQSVVVHGGFILKSQLLAELMGDE